MKKSNPTPALPLSGEGVKGSTADFSTIDAKDNSVDFSIKAETKSNLIYPQTKMSNKEMPLAPPPAKGEAGRGLFNKAKLHNQQKIASVLTAVDQEIDTLQQKLSLLKQEKKALMQQLLTGKRRVMV